MKLRTFLALLTLALAVPFIAAHIFSSSSKSPPSRPPQLSSQTVADMVQQAKNGDKRAERALFNHFAWLDDSPEKYIGLAIVGRETDSYVLQFLLAQSLVDKHRCRTASLVHAYQRTLTRFDEPDSLKHETLDLAEKSTCSADIEKKIDGVLTVAFPEKPFSKQ